MNELMTWKDSILVDSEDYVPELYHTLYQQYYKSLIVEGAEYIEHHDGADVWYTTGFIAEGLDIDVTPTVNESDALNYATTHIGAETYIWDEDESMYPTGELLLALTGDDRKVNGGNYHLCWKFMIIALEPFTNITIYVDAHDGTIRKVISNTEEGSFNHIYYGTKYDLDTRYKGGLYDNFYLHANDYSHNILTTDNTSYHNYPAKTDSQWDWDDMTYSSGDDVWGNSNWSATASHYCAQKTWDFYKQPIFNQNGMRGWGNYIRIVSDISSAYTGGSSAAYSYYGGKDYLLIGRKNNNLTSTYDIIGHEFTHGIVQHSRPLKYEKESGAINESIADIFGFMVERYVVGSSFDWTIGEDMGTTLRNLSSPNAYNHPSIFNGTYWVSQVGCVPSSSNDFCGVHTNSGVGNKWFYLLSQGGSQTVNGQSRSVTGIQIDPAANIVFYAMKNNLAYTENYAAMRSHTIAAAAVRYGICSDKYNKTCQAWYAVNVGPTCVQCNVTWYGRNGNILGETREAKKPFKFEVFPNPADDILRINVQEYSTTKTNAYAVKIYDFNGKVVLENVYTDLRDVSFDISGFSIGVYLINVTSNNWVRTMKFIKK